MDKDKCNYYLTVTSPNRMNNSQNNVSKKQVVHVSSGVTWQFDIIS